MWFAGRDDRIDVSCVTRNFPLICVPWNWVFLLLFRCHPHVAGAWCNQNKKKTALRLERFWEICVVWAVRVCGRGWGVFWSCPYHGAGLDPVYIRFRVYNNKYCQWVTSKSKVILKIMFTLSSNVFLDFVWFLFVECPTLKPSRRWENEWFLAVFHFVFASAMITAASNAWCDIVCNRKFPTRPKCRTKTRNKSEDVRSTVLLQPPTKISSWISADRANSVRVLEKTPKSFTAVHVFFCLKT